MSNDQTVRPVILCGGAGTRLWPLSTSEHPKQFLTLTGEMTMLEATLARVSDTDIFDKPTVIANARHRHFVERMNMDLFSVFEPVGRNSAPAVAVASLLANSEDVLLIMPADHHVHDETAFVNAVKTGLAAVSSERLVTFGIVPEYPATGYGYIRAKDHSQDGILDVLEFVEKPNLETAKRFLSQGNYYWNAGIFLFKAKDMLQALKDYAPDILEGAKTVLSRSVVSHANSPVDLDSASFRELRSESIDYAVMEHSKSLAVLPVDMGWTDIGDFSSLSDFVGPDFISGPVSVERSSNVYVRSEGPEVIVRGVQNLIIVATGEKVLVSSKAEVSGIKPQVNVNRPLFVGG